MVEEKAAAIFKRFRAKIARGEKTTLRAEAIAGGAPPVGPGVASVRPVSRGGGRREPTPLVPAPTPVSTGEEVLKEKDIAISGITREPGRVDAEQERTRRIRREELRVAPAPPSDVRAIPKPTGFLQRSLRAIRIKQFEVEKKKRKRAGAEVAAIPLALAEVGVGTALFGKELITRPRATTKAVGVGLARLGKRIVTGEAFISAGKALRQRPGRTIGLVAGELLLAKGTGAIISRGARITRAGVTVISPKFRPIETTVLGERIITGKQPIGLIPPGVTPKLPVKPLEAARVKIPTIAEPKIPKLTPAQQKVLGIARERGGIVTGSLAERVLVRPRKFADIDILLGKPRKAAVEAARRIGTGVKIKTVPIKTPAGKFEISRIVERKTGKVIADIDPLKFGEERFARKFPTIEVEGIKFISPKARLAAKVAQFGRGKRTQKVIADIERLTAGKIPARAAAKSPLVRGAFGFTKAEQAKFIGVKGTVATSARGLFGPFRRTVEITPKLPLFATPPELGRGIAQTRISRLAIAPPKQASILDLLAGKVAFRRPKPQIVLFPEVTIGKEFRPFGLPGPISKELEVVRQRGRIQKIKTVGVTLIEGERVPIITARLLEGKKPTKAVKGVAVIPTIPTKPPKPISLGKVPTVAEVSREIVPKPVISPGEVIVKGVTVTRRVRVPSKLLKILPRARPPKPPPSLLPSRRPGRVISPPPSIPPSRLPSIPPSRPPSRLPSIPPSVPPSFPPSIPVSLPPSRPPIPPKKALRVPRPPVFMFKDIRLGIPEVKKKRRKIVRPTRFQPSLVAIVPEKKLFGRIPDVLTGLEVRRIPI